MLPLLTTAYAPPISYLALVIKAGGLRLEAQENYEKQSYRNRHRILTGQGIRDLSIPIQHHGGKKIPILDVSCEDKQPWRRLHWRTLIAAYGASPFFLYFKDDLKDIILHGPNNLFELNLQILNWVVSVLNVQISFETTSRFEPFGEENDYRNWCHPKKAGIENPPYIQTFSDRHPFASDLSVIDLIFNLGPEAGQYLVDFGRTLDDGGFAFA